MSAVIARIWRLTRIAASGPGSRLTLALLLVIVGLELSSIWISLQFIDWNARFFDALEQYDLDDALFETGFFFALTAASALRFLVSDYLRKFVLMKWRTRLTEHTVGRWLENKSYWHLRDGLSPVGLENPDQRIAEDCRLFVTGLLREALDLFTRIVGIFSYVAVLWALTDFALRFTVFGVDFAISHYLVWASFIYVLLSSILTHLLGWPLKDLLFNQQRREADFRYALVQLRDNAAEVAMAGGEGAEERRFDQRFSAIIENWRRLIGREFVVGLFTRPYFQTVLRIPLFLSLPAYLAREVSLGGLMQLASAFSNVTTTLSWFIFSYRDLADFVATSERLDGLLKNLAAGERFNDVPTTIEQARAGDKISLRDLALYTPRGRRLLDVASLDIDCGERVWLHAPSGAGKTTLLRAIAGIWPYGSGRITLPRNNVFFASQDPYLSQGGIGPSLTYPHNTDLKDIAALAAVLERVGLRNRARFLESDGSQGIEGLSNGERQRLVFARILLAKPSIIVLDEATSALNRKAESAMYRLLREDLPDATIICVAHHLSAGLKATRKIDLADFRPADAAVT